jgi:hypothetical protein
MADDTGTASFAGDNIKGVYVWGAQVDIGPVVTRYQRVGAVATDYDAVGFPYYLRFDGVDDSLVVAAGINFTTTDKMSVWAGITKSTDALVGMLFEFTSDINTISGAFGLAVPGVMATPDYSFRTRGATNPALVQISGFPAPISNVLSAQYDNAGSGSGASAQVRPRINGVAQTAGGATTAGNYANAQLFIGRRGGATLPFNGQLNQLIVRAGLTSAAQIAQMEQFIAGKMQIVIP